MVEFILILIEYCIKLHFLDLIIGSVRVYQQVSAALFEIHPNFLRQQLSQSQFKISPRFDHFDNIDLLVHFMNRVSYSKLLTAKLATDTFLGQIID